MHQARNGNALLRQRLLSATRGGMALGLGLAVCVGSVASASPALGAPTANHGALHALESEPTAIGLSVGRGRAASNGDGWLVVYASSEGVVVGRRVDASGTPELSAAETVL
jgi:hypothetical protein